MKMKQQMSLMVSLASLLRKLCCLLLMPGFLGATSLMKVKIPDGNPVRIGFAEANDFFTNSRPKRNVDPKWYRGNPDFQSYYRFYNSIGHIEGLYEIDWIRMLYQQMRFLELTYGPDSATYQNKMGVITGTTGPATTAHPPAPSTMPAPTQNPLENAQKIYLCNPKDPLCKPKIVYLPTGAVPILCDPRINPLCRAKTEKGTKTAVSKPTPATPAPGNVDPPAPPPVTMKGMEYDCDPYWDPDCLIDQSSHPVQEASSPATLPEDKLELEDETTDKGNVPVVSTTAKKKNPYPYFDPYDFKRDLYDPFHYAESAPDPQ
ncbi:hypothetical protein AMECASPLE_012244 [Ameca splendens]|uniref:Actinodin3 n=1 Tax=Ameca splendens TaxID=208324 RepID=A0ABV0XPW8_9TELE